MCAVPGRGHAQAAGGRGGAEAGGGPPARAAGARLCAGAWWGAGPGCAAVSWCRLNRCLLRYGMLACLLLHHAQVQTVCCRVVILLLFVYQRMSSCTSGFVKTGQPLLCVRLSLLASSPYMNQGHMRVIQSPARVRPAADGRAARGRPVALVLAGGAGGGSRGAAHRVARLHQGHGPQAHQGRGEGGGRLAHM